LADVFYEKPKTNKITFKFFTMNKIQINQSRMFAAVLLAFDNHSEVVDKFPKLKTAVLKFKNGQVIIDQNRQVQEYNASGLTTGKTKLRENLKRRILQFSKVLMAHGTSVENEELITMANYSETDLVRKSDKILFDIGDLLMTQAIPIKAELAIYDVGDAEFENMKNLLEEFKKSIPKKRGAANVSKVSTENIADVFKSQRKLLKDVIDKHMGPLEFTYPEFFKTYKNARKVVGYTGRRSKSTPLEPPTPLKAEKERGREKETER